jgi:glucose-6-phosphate dehydrogenase assembly protein OpcA
MASTVNPGKLLRELDELWVGLGQQAGESDGVLRACSMTLLVAVEGEREAAETPETLAQLMRDHPSRAIVLRLDPGEGGELHGRVYAQCWMPFGRRQQICCEHIEISFCSSALNQVAPLAAALLAPDLPVVLWCRSARLLDQPAFEPVLRLPRKIIIDSSAMTDLSAQFRLIHSLRNRGLHVADLSWTRLTRWRETLAKIFEDPVYQSRLPAISSLSLGWDGDSLPISACYFAAWLRACLGRKIEVNFRRLETAPRPRLHTVALSGEELGIVFSVDQDRTLDLIVGGHETHSIFPSLTDYELLREELFVLGRDQAWEAMLPHLPDLLNAAGFEVR